jgi:hypothetical protein
LLLNKLKPRQCFKARLAKSFTRAKWRKIGGINSKLAGRLNFLLAIQLNYLKRGEF